MFVALGVEGCGLDARIQKGAAALSRSKCEIASAYEDASAASTPRGRAVTLATGDDRNAGRDASSGEFMGRVGFHEASRAIVHLDADDIALRDMPYASSA